MRRRDPARSRVRVLVALLVLCAAPAATPATGRRQASGGRPSTPAGASRRATPPGAETPDFDDAALARARPAARLGDRGAVRPEDQPAPGRAAVLRRRPGTASASRCRRRRRGRLLLARVRRRDVERDRLPERPRARRPAVRLHRLRARPHAPPRFGGENVLAVRLAPEPESSRWYPGAGIYRHVWLDATGPVHVARWGTYVTTPAVTDAGATVARPHRAAQPRGRSRRASRSRRRSWTPRAARSRARVEPSRRSPASDGGASTARITRPEARSAGTSTGPYLYTAVSTVKRGGRGARPLRRRRSASARSSTAPTKGFLLNGRRVQLQGVCNHHDLGALGRGGQPPRDRAPARDPEAHGRERHPHQPQPAGAGAARARRPHGLPRHGRGLRHVGHAEGEERPRQVLRRVGRARPARHDPARPQPPERRDVEHRQRDPRAGGAGRLEGGEAAHRHLPRGGPDAARRPPASTRSENAIKNRLADQVDIPGFNYGVRAVREDPAPSTRAGRSWARRRRPASARAASTTCRSRSTRSTPRCRSRATT